MAEIMNLEGAPENCAHDCNACSAGCEMNPDGKQEICGRQWRNSPRSKQMIFLMH